jgi:hypothetical protein
MPITFGCDCGKQFTVADEFAGKRTKCPACKSALIVPEAAPTTPPAPEEEPLSDEDKAFRALAEAPDPEPSFTPARRDPATTDAPPRRSFPASPPPPPPPAPARKRKPRFDAHSSDGKYERRRGPAIAISPAVAGGLLSIVIAVAWFGLGLAADRIYFYPPIMFLFGLVAVVRGLLGYSED